MTSILINIENIDGGGPEISQAGQIADIEENSRGDDTSYSRS
jgi:hypothetical protein